MRQSCAPVCQTCKDLHVDTRCPLDPNGPVAWQPGDMHRMFERSVAQHFRLWINIRVSVVDILRFFCFWFGLVWYDLTWLERRIASNFELQHYEPKVLSRPSYRKGDSEETADYQLGPWVVILDSFLTDDECERLIELGAIEGYKRSSDVGEKKEDGTFAQDYSKYVLVLACFLVIFIVSWCSLPQIFHNQGQNVRELLV